MGADPGPQPFHFRYQSFAIEVGEVFVHSESSSKLHARLPTTARLKHKAHKAH
jgi:hypothetical protein